MSAALADLTILNEQLAALTEAGVPLDLGLGASAKQTEHHLERVNATLARRVELGEPLAEALEDDNTITSTPYRSLVRLGLRSGTLYEGLGISNQLASSVDQTRYALRAAVWYPLILCLLAYVGLIGFCLVLVPILTDLYQSLRIPAGFGLRSVQSLREALPIWVWLVPVAITLWVVWKLRNRYLAKSPVMQTGAIVGSIPGVGPVFSRVRAANFADSLAKLLENGVTLDEGLRLAANTTGDAHLSEAARALSAALRKGEMPSDEGPVALMYPPLLRWALWRAEEAGGRVSGLRMTARIYRETAERRTNRVRMLAPIIAYTLIGGAVTLLYGLALFLPMIEMLESLATKVSVG